MPLVTRTANQTSVYIQASAPDTSLTGLWIDTDDGAVYSNKASSWVQQTVGALGTASQVIKVNSGATAITYGAGATVAGTMANSG